MCIYNSQLRRASTIIGIWIAYLSIKGGLYQVARGLSSAIENDNLPERATIKTIPLPSIKSEEYASSTKNHNLLMKNNNSAQKRQNYK